MSIPIECYNSLENSGNVVIINGTKNLYIRNYLTLNHQKVMGISLK